MGFADEVRAQTRTGKQCKMCTYLAEMSDKDRAEIDEVMGDTSIPTSPIVRALNRRGIDVHQSTVYRHRQQCHVAA